MSPLRFEPASNDAFGAKGRDFRLVLNRSAWSYVGFAAPGMPKRCTSPGRRQSGRTVARRLLPVNRYRRLAIRSAELRPRPLRKVYVGVGTSCSMALAGGYQRQRGKRRRNGIGNFPG
jgi:hypothetical protein